MGDGLSVDTGATDRVAAALGTAATRLADPTDLVADLAGRVAGYAAPRTPRATGALANAFSTAPATVAGHTAQELTWGVRYAVYVNFGTSRMPARPFATDALQAAAADADTAFTNWASHIIDTI